MNDTLECEICGCKATRMLGYHPLCKHVECEEALLDIVNGELQEESENMNADNFSS